MSQVFLLYREVSLQLRFSKSLTNHWFQTPFFGFFNICVAPVKCSKKELNRQPLRTCLQCLSIQERKNTISSKIQCIIVDRAVRIHWWISFDQFATKFSQDDVWRTETVNNEIFSTQLILYVICEIFNFYVKNLKSITF